MTRVSSFSQPCAIVTSWVLAVGAVGVLGTGCMSAEATPENSTTQESPEREQALSAETASNAPDSRYVVTAPSNSVGDVAAAALWAPVCVTHGRPATRSVHPTGVQTWLLGGGTVLGKGDVCQWGKARLIMQSDGNLVIYDENSRARWASNTVGSGDHTSFQTDGNFVVYTASGQALHTGNVPSNTCCHTGYDLHVQEDGNVVIYAPGWNPVWATGTNH